MYVYTPIVPYIYVSRKKITEKYTRQIRKMLTRVTGVKSSQHGIEKIKKKQIRKN